MRLTQSQFEPIEITRNYGLSRRGTEADERDAGRINLRLDPGLAFWHGQPSDHAPVFAMARATHAERAGRDGA